MRKPSYEELEKRVKELENAEFGRKKAEEALQESEIKLSQIVEGCSIPIFVIDKNHTVIYWNKACENLTGVSAGEMVGTKKQWSPFYSTERPVMADVILDNLTDEEIAKYYHGKYQKSALIEGAYEAEKFFPGFGNKWLFFTAAPLRNQRGNVVGAIETLRDITRQKQAEKVLIESKEQYRMLAEQAGQMMYDYDIASGKISWTGDVPTITGYTHEEFQKVDISGWEKRIHSEDRETVSALLDEAMGKCSNYKVEYRFERKDGTYLYVEDKGLFLNDEKGKAHRMLGIMKDITDRKRAEEALKESEKKIRNIIEHSTNVFYSHTPEHVITYMSPQVKEILGYEVNEVLVKWTDLVSENPINERGFELTVKAIETGKQQPTYELELVHKSGKKVWIEVHEKPVVVNGKTISIVGAFTDITERKKAEVALEESESFLDNIISQSPSSLWISDEKGAIIKLNPACRDLFGIKNDDNVIGKYNLFEDNLLEEQGFMPLIENVFEKGEIARFTIDYDFQKVEHVNVDGGTYRILDVVISPIKDKYGKITNAIVQHKDITERKKAEESLQEREKQLSDILDNATIHVWAFDGEWYPFLSKEWYRYTGQDTTLPRTIERWTEVVHPDDLDKASKTWFKAWNSKGVYDDHFRLKGAEGEYRLFQSHAIPIYDENGSLQHYQGFNIDITEQKIAEESIKLLSSQLKEKNKELEQIVYVTSHDLRSPLVNVQGFSKELDECLKEVKSALRSIEVPAAVKEKIYPLLKDDIPEAIRFILIGVAKIDSLISGLLRLSRLGSTAISMENLDMNKLMSDISNTLEFQLKEKNVTLKIGDLPSCTGDKTQINQVFSDILDNAIKYLDPNRPGTISISGIKEKGKVIYCVKDNGIGIAPAHKEKIFEIFHRLNPKDTAGEGLGLTIVRRILDRHRGRIWVESEPGKESKFFVSLFSKYTKKGL